MMAVYVTRVARVYLAQSAAEGDIQIAELERAIHLAPDDAELPHLLGMRLSAAGEDSQSAIANLKRAVSLNPHRGYYWLDLAALYEVEGNIEPQNEAVQSALRAEPYNPEIGAQAGQFFLESGDPDRAFPLFKQALTRNPEAVDSILRVCWKQAPDAKLILARAIPEDPVLQLAFLRMLADQGELGAASDVWKSIVSARKPFDPRLSFFYFDFLLKEQDVAGFKGGWEELSTLAPEIRAYLPGDNLIVNGSFDKTLLNSGLDWRHQSADNIAVGIDDRVAHSGAHSLALSYNGKPAYDSGWTEFVPVQGNRDYEFSAWIRSDSITTSSGPRIELIDALSGNTLLLTDDVLDTHPWHEIKGTVHVPEETLLLAVKIVRAPANTRIRGRVWIDDLSLVKRPVENLAHNAVTR
jgi:tetratricopeptide (TPR) repeat protein